MLPVFWILFSLAKYSSSAEANNKTGCACYNSVNEVECKCFLIEIKNLEEISSFYPQLCSSGVSKWIFEKVPNLERLNPNNLSEFNGCNWSAIKNLEFNQTGLVRLDDLSPFRALETLVIAHNHKLTSYNGQGFEAVGQHLKTLKLRANPIRSITRSTFRGLQALEYLDLTANRIGHIEQGTFSQNCCQNIRELILRQNFLTDLDGEHFKGLLDLEHLDLHDNPLQQLDANVFQPIARTLTHLYISHSDDVSFGGIKTLAPFLFNNLNKLCVLYMEELKIINLTSQHFANLSSLERLSLRGNRLINLENDIFQSLINLKYIDLSSNKLICIPSALNPHTEHDFLSGLPQLEWIDLSNNKLTHLNHLTARSLGLFESTVRAEKSLRLMLKIDSNPWQHIDGDSFCNPNFLSTMRPVDLIVGPSSNKTFTAWRVSPGFWYSRVEWPNGPLSLIGPTGRIMGLAIHRTNSSRHTDLTSEETKRLGYTDAVLGDPDLPIRCDQLINSGEVMINRTIAENMKGIKPSASLIAFSIASYCPKLPIRELTRKEIGLLGLMDLLATINSSHKRIALTQSNSRLYLLVIVGICVAFLLIALTVIMCYRAWTRQSSIDYPNHESAVKLGQTGGVHGSTEKHQLLTQIDQKEILADGNLERNGTSVQNGESPNLPSRSRNTHVRTSRPKSDSEAVGVDDIHELTAFGVV